MKTDNVRNKGGRVFVHCHAGISRSATVCIAYMMQHKRISSQEAYTYVKEKRSIISPNLSFMGQLMLYQQELQSVWVTEAGAQTKTVITDVKVPIATSSEICTTKSTSPQQSLANSTNNVTTLGLHSSSCVSSTEYYAKESRMVSQLTDKLNMHQQMQFCRKPPLYCETSRSYSVPMDLGPVISRSVSKRKREEMRLSLELNNSRKSPQLSPCRIEAATLNGSKITQSLTLSSTCT